LLKTKKSRVEVANSYTAFLTFHQHKDQGADSAKIKKAFVFWKFNIDCFFFGGQGFNGES